MINYGELEDAALYGIEESLDFELDGRETGWIVETPDLGYQCEEIAEAIYAKYMGWVC